MEVEKFALFAKGLVHDINQKFEVSLFHFSLANWSKRAFGNVLNRKRAFLDYKNVDIRKLQSCYFCQKGWSVILVKNFKFPHLVFSVQIDQKECFATFSILKTCFYPTNKLTIKSWKVCIFWKGVTPWFWSKLWSFFTFTFLGQIDEKECLAMFLIENELF